MTTTALFLRIYFNRHLLVPGMGRTYVNCRIAADYWPGDPPTAHIVAITWNDGEQDIEVDPQQEPIPAVLESLVAAAIESAEFD